MAASVPSLLPSTLCDWKSQSWNSKFRNLTENQSLTLKVKVLNPDLWLQLGGWTSKSTSGTSKWTSSIWTSVSPHSLNLKP